jgi:hypothetical protein
MNMWSVFGWVLFGFAIWAMVLVMHVLQKRFAPEWQSRASAGSFWTSMWGDDGESPPSAAADADVLDEIEALKHRVQVLEAIVTDRGFQVDDEIRR